MTIGIDGRLINQTGVGRYIKNLIFELSRIDHNHTYIVYLGDDAYEEFILPNERWEKRLLTVHWHTLKEQFVLPGIFAKDNIDILHIPYFTIPLFYQRPMIVTIHDVIPLHVMTGKATQLPFFLYILKWIGYYIILFFGLRKAKKIIAVSETTKQEIVDHFHIDPEKIEVTYEGISLPRPTTYELRPKIQDPYFLYVGNAYPHKNLELLVKAFLAYRKKNAAKHTKLLLVGKEDIFYKKLQHSVQREKAGCDIQFLGYVDDETLASYYANAQALVFPSLMEGFGLPALEALSYGCPVICSDIRIFREILRDIPLYVSPKDTNAWVKAMEKMITENSRIKKEQMKRSEDILSRYQWKDMAQKTLIVYEDCTRV